jgi:hypothetical protein
VSPKRKRAFVAGSKLRAAEGLVDEATNEIASCVPSIHPVIDELRAALLQLRRAQEIVRQTIRRIP